MSPRTFVVISLHVWMGPVHFLGAAGIIFGTSHRVKLGAVKIMPLCAAETGLVDGAHDGLWVCKRWFFVSYLVLTKDTLTILVNVAN